MNLKLLTCFIAVHDHDEALAFYRDLLGLEVRMDVKYEGMRWTTVGPKDQPDVNIVLEPPAADPNVPPGDRKVMKEMLAKGLLRGVIFSIEDCDAIFEHVRAGGGEVLQEPMDMPYGPRECAFRDPSGNLIRFSQRKA
jgi:predicted enzyme related to lactoylglutathione lyase